MQRPEQRAESVAVVDRVFGFERRGHGIEIRLGLRAADAGLQARERRVAVRPSVVIAQGFGVEEERLPDLDRAIGELEPGRHDANDLCRPAIDRNRLPDDRPTGAEPPRPERVTQDDHIVAARLILTRDERAADLRGRAEQRKERGGHDGAVDALGVSAAGEVEAHRVVRGHLFEHVTAIAIVHILAGGGRDVVEAGPAQVAPDDHQAVRIAVRQWTEQYAIDDREDCGVGANAERQREKHDGRKSGIPAQVAEAIANVGRDQLRPQHGADRPNGFQVVRHLPHRFVV